MTSLHRAAFGVLFGSFLAVGVVAAGPASACQPESCPQTFPVCTVLDAVHTVRCIPVP